MFNVNNLFGKGLKNTLLLKNGLNFSINGPFTVVRTDTVLDRWDLTSISGAEYTLLVDFDNNNREMIRCLLVGNPSNATVTVYGRSTVGDPLINLSATVSESYVKLIVNPTQNAYSGAKVIFQATYFETQNPLQK
jgi:hypothetical protein